MKTYYPCILLALILVLNSCQKESILTQSVLNSDYHSNAVASDPAYFLNGVISTPKQYIPTRIWTQSSGEATNVFTTFHSGHIDSLHILLTAKNRAMIQTMYANGIQVSFKNAHDLLGSVAVDLMGDSISGASIPIRTIFKPAGNGYQSGAIFQPVLFSMRISGITHQDSVPGVPYKLVGSKPQISIEKTASIQKNITDTLLTIDLKAVASFVTIEHIPIAVRLTNASVPVTSLQVTDSTGATIGTVSANRPGGVLTFDLSLRNDYTITSNRTYKVYLVGKLNMQQHWSATFSLGTPNLFAWKDDTNTLFKGQSNTVYYTDQRSGDYYPYPVVYP